MLSDTDAVEVMVISKQHSLLIAFLIDENLDSLAKSEELWLWWSYY